MRKRGKGFVCNKGGLVICTVLCCSCVSVSARLHSRAECAFGLSDARCYCCDSLPAYSVETCGRDIQRGLV